jgi:hypothetical protein
MSETITDAHGVPLREGARVRVYGFDAANDNAIDYCGVVEGISDPDGDVGDHGQPIFYPPRVSVLFDAGDRDSFMVTWTAEGWWDEDAPYQCEDLEVLAADGRTVADVTREKILGVFGDAELKFERDQVRIVAPLTDENMQKVIAVNAAMLDAGFNADAYPGIVCATTK